MPIYAYRCADCGHQFDALQKITDAALTDCPACGKPALAKLVTAAGFQLKGSGWYQTDFRSGSTPAKQDGDKPASGDAKPDGKPGTSTGGGAGEPAAPAKSAAACSPGCACH